MSGERICVAVLGPDGGLADVAVTESGKTRHLFGRAAAKTEAELADKLLAAGDVLPVFLGTGLGLALERVLAATAGPVAVVDKEADLAAATGALARLEREFGDRLLVVDAADPDTAVAGLTRWQLVHGGKTLVPALNPAYLRLDGRYYGDIARRLETARAADLPGRAAYPRFAANRPRVLCIQRENYFIQPEITTALTRLGSPTAVVTVSATTGAAAFIAALLEQVLSFKPDFVLTLNHHGVDPGGMFTGLLASLRLPLASWLVDNPETLLAECDHLAGPLVTLFSCDAASMDGLAARGHRVRYLPLCADPELFAPIPDLPTVHPWRSRVSFVGEDFRLDTAARLKSGRFGPELLRAFAPVSKRLAEGPETRVEALLADHPEALAAYRALTPPTRRREFELAALYNANRLHRLRLLEKTLEFAPLLAGPPGLARLTRGRPGARRTGFIAYNTELPLFYQLAEITFNTTGVHMRGALNQRLFDAPACGAFVLTDHTPQLETLFDPDTEVACYHSPDEITDLIRRYLADPASRTSIAQAARKRILAEHTYMHRMATILSVMRQSYA